MNTPLSTISVSSKQYEKIRNEIKLELENKNSKKAWPRGSNDVNLLFDFIKGKVPLRERIDVNGDRCKSTKQLCAKGCITGKRCVLKPRVCKIRSNETNIKNFIARMFEYSPHFQHILSEFNKTSDCKFIVQSKLFSLGAISTFH